MDSVENWFKYEPPKGKSGKQKSRDRVRSNSGSAHGGSKSKSRSNQNSKQRIIQTLKGSPEVMVKITGSSDGISKAMAHLKYIARQGNVEVEDENNVDYKDKESLYEIKFMMQAAQVPINSKKREYIHVLFSMPPNTPANELKEAVKTVCADEFSNRNYYMALHDDTDHTHVHVLVSMRDKDRANEARLDPRKPDIKRWRMKFAEELNDRGIDASATSRSARMKFEKGDSQAVANMGKFDPESKHYNPKAVESLASTRYQRATRNPEKAFVGAYRPHQKSFIEATRKIHPKLPEAFQETVKEAMEKSKKGWEQIANSYPELKAKIDTFVNLAQDRNDTIIDQKIQTQNEKDHEDTL